MGTAKTTINGAASGAIAAAVWAAVEPLDKPVFKCDYSDVEFLGKAVTRGPRWRPIGFASHIINGALFGAIYANLSALKILPPVLRGTVAGLIEHLVTWPATAISDRLHPAREELTQLNGNRNAFAQATFRHILFGGMLGFVEHAMNPPVLEPKHQGDADSNAADGADGGVAPGTDAQPA